MSDLQNYWAPTGGQPARGGFQDKIGYQFPDPFLDVASLSMPRAHKDVLDLAEFFWNKSPTYKMACSRIVRYFITKIKFEDVDEDQRKKLDRFHNDIFRAPEQLAMLGDDFICYGNSFSSITLPFRRYLVCKETGLQQPASNASWEFDFERLAFKAYHPKLKRWTECYHIDRRCAEEDKIKVRRWSPREIKILHHPYGGQTEFFWEIPKDLAKEVKNGSRFYVEHMPWEIIQAIHDEQLFKFNDGVVYHMKEGSVAGVKERGWGVSRMMGVFTQAYYSQVLKRYNEALALDYVVPFRVLTPTAASKEADPLIHADLSSFTSNVMSMIRTHRRDPASWHALPFPLQYQALGGEAKAMSTPELLNQAMDELLNAVGIPAELYRFTLQLQIMPTALRLFQQTWPQITSNFNGWLEWANTIICTAMNWDKPEHTYLEPVTLADDVELRQIWLQLASSNMISRSTAFSPWGVDAIQEQKKIFDENKIFAEMQAAADRDMKMKQSLSEQMASMTPGAQYMSQQQAAAQQQQGGGQPPPGAMGSGVSPTAGMGAMTPNDMLQQAESTAQQLVSQPYEARRKTLSDIKNTNQTLYSLVKQKMEELRTEASSQGRQQLLQGGGGQ